MTRVRVAGFSVSLDGFGADLSRVLKIRLASAGWNFTSGSSVRACSAQ